MNMSGELLKIAGMDLQASRLLYDDELYPQSVFYFQQSVEKANKSFALISNQATEKELPGNIGHKAIKIYENALIQQKHKYERFNETLNSFPEIKTINLLKNFNIKEELSQFDQLLSDIGRITKEKNELHFISSWEIHKILRETYHINKNLKKEKRKVSKIKITEEEWNKIKNNILELYDSLSKYNPIKVEEEKKNLEKIDLKQLETSIKNYLLLIYSSISIATSLYNLSIVTLPHSVITRYPKNDFTPVAIYTKKFPIVKKLPELSKVQNNALDELKIFNKKLEEINAKVH